jgi:hypothetical protein
LLYDLRPQENSQTANNVNEHNKILGKIKNYILQNDILKPLIRGPGRPPNDCDNMIS